MTPAQQCAVVRFCRVGVRVSARRACRVVGLPRSSYRSRSVARDQTTRRQRLRDLAAARGRSGDRRLHGLRQRAGWRVKHKRVSRLDREAGLGSRVKRRRQRVSGLRVLPPPAQRPQERGSLDCLTDRLADGRRFRVVTIGENVSRVSPAIAVGRSVTGERVVGIWARLPRTGGVLERIASDHGPAVMSKALDACA